MLSFFSTSIGESEFETFTIKFQEKMLHQKKEKFTSDITNFNDNSFSLLKDSIDNSRTCMK